MGSREIHHRTLVRACTIVGDESVLARHLGVSVGVVVQWLIGTTPVPLDKFLAAVDIVLAHKLEHLRPKEIAPEKYDYFGID